MVERGRCEEAVATDAGRLAALRRAAEELAATSSLDDLCRRAVEVGREWLGFERLSIWLVEPDRGSARGTFGIDEQGCLRDERHCRLSLAAGTFVELAGSGEASIRQDHPLRDSRGRVIGRGAAASVLLRHDGQVVGVLHADRLLSGQPLTALDGELLALFGNSLGLLVGAKGALLERQADEATLRAQSLSRQRAEEGLRRLAAALEQTSEGVVITDLEGVVVFANRAFERMSGYRAEEVLGRNIGLVRSGQHDAAFYDTMWTMLLSGRTWQGQIINRRKDGSLYREEATITPIRDDRGQTVSYVSVKRDIGEQTRLEEQLRQAAKMEAVGQLAGGVAHDFNNLLTTIQGYAEMLQLDLPDGPHKQDVAQILAAAERAGTLTRQLLAFSRRQLIEPILLDLNQVVAEIETMLRRTLGERIRLETLLSAAPAWVCADRGQVDQLLINLAVNARDAMPHGGTLTIDTCQVLPHEVWGPGHESRPTRTYVRLRVHDTGTGIDPATKAKIFEPFFTTKPPGRGTGLGLSTVYGIVHQSGGTISVESAVGQGTTMTVYLPEVVPPQIALPPAPAEPDHKSGTEIILLVEDEPSVRMLTQHILRTHGYTVHEAEDGFQAMDLIRRTALHIDLLITDLVMPGMNGKELAMRLRSHFSELKVLYMSGYSDNLPATGGESQGPTTFLQKPFSPEDLIRLVREILHSVSPA
ncbi:MAG: response regulator [Armatimonadetes bacterium]|nr:response regulator [Armatimonadota bacterium]